MYLNSLAASDSKNSIAYLTYEGTKSSNNTVMHRIIFSWFCLKLMFTWRGITFVSLVQQWDGSCASSLRTERVRMASFTLSWKEAILFHLKFTGNVLKYSFKIEVTEIRKVGDLYQWLPAVLLQCQNVLRTFIYNLN